MKPRLNNFQLIRILIYLILINVAISLVEHWSELVNKASWCFFMFLIQLDVLLLWVEKLVGRELWFRS